MSGPNAGREVGDGMPSGGVPGAQLEALDGDAERAGDKLKLPPSANTCDVRKPPAMTSASPPAAWSRWLDSLATLAINERELPWGWGDAVNAGEQAFGQEFSQAFEIGENKHVFIEAQGGRLDTGLTMSAINNRAWVSRCFSSPTRVGELSWSHHRLLAKDDYSDEDRRHWLMRARDEGLTVRQLRELLLGPPKPKPERYTRDEWIAAMRERFAAWPDRVKHRNNLSTGFGHFLEWVMLP